MNKHTRRAAVVFIFVLVSAFLMPVPSRVRVPAFGAKAQNTTPAQAREEAYRANNLGVALLEQFKHKEGADQFRRALALDPKLALARINLAIALLNVPDAAAARKEAIAAAVAAPDAPQPHYVLGLLAKSENRPEEALAAFQRVLKIDPRDVGANVQVGQLYAQQRKYPEAVAAFRTALNEEPYNGTALYNLGTALLRAGQREEGQRLVQQFQALRQSGAATIIGQNYLEQGRYAEAVASTGAESDLVDKRTPEVSFADATSAVLPTSATSAAGEKGLAGGPTLFDADGDGDLDLAEAAGASPRLYRNDAGKLADVSAQAGALSKAVGGGAFVAGDYDNDERTDLLLIREGAVALFRNEGSLRFADVTTAARVPAYPYVSHSAAFVDYDHDGDLDIFVAGLADRSKPKGPPPAPGAARALSTYAPAPHLLLRNNGDGTFADQTAAARLTPARADAQATAVVPTDYDNRRDVDLLVVHKDGPPALYRNLRDGSFRDVAAEVGLDFKGRRCAGAAAADVNKDGFTDFFFFACGADPVNSAPGLFAMSDGKGRFDTRDAPPATRHANAAQLLDYDNDGLLDLLTVNDARTQGAIGVLRNTGDGWADVSESAARGLSGAALEGQAAAFAAGDADGDGDTDIFARSAAGGVKFLRNDGGNRNASVRVRLAGKVSNRGGVGAKIEARAGSLWQKSETYSATPAPAPADVLFGLGKRTTVDAVRVLWPAGIVQAETVAAPAAASRNALSLTVTELDRKPSSCPYLYTWNGERFEFVTDFMGGGELGYWAAPGVRAQPDPDEYVRIRGDQLRPRAGRYELRVTNELEEALFIDRLQLVAVAHPAGLEVYPNEGLGNPTSAAFKLHATRDARPPRAATDEHGHDVLARVARLDRTYPDDFKLHALRGYADEHTLTLDLSTGEDKQATDDSAAADRRRDARLRTASPSSFVPRPTVRGPRSSPLLLLMTGWTDYAFSSDNVAASQTGRTLRAPALQVRDAAGNWRTVIDNIGIPVGRPQTVAVDLTGKFLSASREVRLVTNMRIYWDQILVAAADTAGKSVAASPLRVERLDAAAATLDWRGFSAETTPDGREPFLYDYDKINFTSPWKTLPGRYTRLGDVRELLRATDDLFVVSRPGDEIALSFDASALAPLPRGWTRTFLLYSDGFSKEMDLNSASPDQLAPLPFHAMKTYPYAAPEAYPSTPAHRDYVERYNTRVVNTPVRKVVGGQWPAASERQEE